MENIFVSLENIGIDLPTLKNIGKIIGSGNNSITIEPKAPYIYKNYVLVITQEKQKFNYLEQLGNYYNKKIVKRLFKYQEEEFKKTPLNTIIESDSIILFYMKRGYSVNESLLEDINEKLEEMSSDFSEWYSSTEFPLKEIENLLEDFLIDFQEELKFYIDNNNRFANFISVEDIKLKANAIIKAIIVGLETIVSLLSKEDYIKLDLDLSQILLIDKKYYCVDPVLFESI